MKLKLGSKVNIRAFFSVIAVALSLTGVRSSAQTNGTCTASPPGLAALWRGEGSGYDSAGNAVATLLNGAGFTNGEVGQAFSFNGSGSALKVQATPALDLGSSSTGFSVETWINPVNAGLEQDLVEWNNGAGFIGVHLSLSVPYLAGGPGSIWANLVDTGGIAHQISTVPGVVASGVYQHVALTYSKLTGLTTLYLNGSVVAQTNLGSFTPYTATDFYVGWRPSGPFTGLFYGGAIDELALYNRDLSGAEIEAIYSAGAYGKCLLAPAILNNPISQSVTVGGTANFEVTVSGDQPLSYVWSFNGTNTVSTSGPSLTLTGVQPSNAGSYSVVVSNSAGTVASSAATLTVNSAVGCVAPPSGLVGWWRGEGNTSDSTGTNDGTIVNGVSYVPGEVGQGFAFTGVSSGVNLGNPTNLQLQNFTLEAWIKRGSSTQCSWDVFGIAHFLGAAWGGYGMGMNDAGHIFLTKIGYSNVYSTNAVTETNSFHHIVVTKSGSTVVFYIDGEAETAAPYDPGFVFNGTFAIGARGSDYNSTFRGAVDEASIYNRPLSSTEVESLYQAGSAGKCVQLPNQTCVAAPSGLVAWWRGEGNANDSENGNNGTFTNPEYANAEVGAAFSFDGSGNNVRVPASPSLDVGSGGGLTIEGWINSTDNTYGRPIAEWVSPIVGNYAVHFYAHAIAPGVLYANLVDTTGNSHVIQSATGLVHTNVLQHVAVSYDKASGIGRLYVNGAIVQESSLGTFTPLTSPDLSIGYRPSTVPFGPIPFFGQIDELSIYSRALASNEVMAIYNAGSAGKCLGSPCAPAPSGLVSWWKADGNAADVAGANNGILQNGTGFAPGKVQQSFVFNGTDQYVEIPDSPSLNPTNALSLETWVYVSGNPQTDVAAVLYKFSPTDGSLNQYQLVTHLVNGSLYFRPVLLLPSGYAALDGKTAIAFNTWYHVAMTYDGAALNLYVNGALDGTVAASGPVLAKPVPLLIGGPSSGPWWFNGRVDEVSLYDRALSVSEVQAIYNAGSIGKCFTQTAPVIVSQPTNQTVVVGTSTTFNVIANGTGPLSYQWFFGTKALPQGTNAALTLNSVQFSDAGAYSVIISNSAGSVASSVATLFVTSGTCLAPPAGLISWWKGDGNALDSAGGNHGVLLNGTNYAMGEVQQAFTFNGVNQYVQIPDAPSLNPTNALSLETWVYVSGNPQTDVAAILYKFSPTDARLNQYQLVTHLVNGNLYFRSVLLLPSGYAALDGKTVIAFNTWYHVAMTYDGSALNLYVNGALDGSVAASGPVLPKPVPFLIGGASGGPWWFNGRVDEVSLYDRALSASEVQAVYAAGASGKCPVAPSFEVQPESQTATVGSTVSFSPVVAGSLPMNFVWFFGNNALTGQTNSSLTLSNISQANQGQYSLLAMNSAGSATSSVAVLTVTLPPTSIQMANPGLADDGTVTVPVLLAANGNENAAGFSINFDPMLLTYEGTVLGGGASNGTILVNSSQAASGKVGIAVAMPAGITFAAGTQQLAVLTFSSAVVSSNTTTTLAFGDTPIKRQLTDASGASLAANFVPSTQLTLPVTAVEGDVYPRPDGDYSLTINDWVQVGRYVAALDSPTNSAEFQRADCAPRDTLGDGALTVSDWVQAGRYAAGLDAAVRAGGPTSPVPVMVVGSAISSINRKGQTNPRQLSIMAPLLNQAQSGTVQVALQAQGDENALAFSVSFDPSRLIFNNATLGNSAVGANLNINANHAAQGQLGFALALSPGQTFPAAAEQVVNINFSPVAPLSGTTTLSFADQPVMRGVADANATLLPTDYVNGAVVVNPLPSLRIATSGTSVTLSWPAAATGFVLQESADASTAGWSQSSATPVVANNEATVSIPLSSTKRFYRLYHP